MWSETFKTTVFVLVMAALFMALALGVIEDEMENRRNEREVVHEEVHTWD